MTVQESDWGGVPLRRTLRLLALPAVFIAVLVLLRVHAGTMVLYGFALIFGVLLLASLRHGPEALLAVLVMYMPLARLYAIDLAPGLNGSNILELLTIGVWVVSSVMQRRPLFVRRPFTRLVGAWAVLSLLSVPTAMLAIGVGPFLWNYSTSLRGFIDQFVVFYLFVNLITDKGMARRMLVYILLAAAVSYVYGFHEWFGTRGLSSIEKSRIGGPIAQPNEYAAFIIYTIAPLLAVGASYFPRWKSLRLAPVALIALRVLLGTFSRAGYLALGAEALTVTLLRSRRLLVLLLAVAAGVYFFAPQYLPESMRARVAQTYEDRTLGGSFDRSAEERILLWEAAVKMSLDSPFLGKGYEQFSRLAEDYVSQYTKATDNQNMFLYVASNMGVPALAVFLTLLLSFGWRGWQLARRKGPEIDRIIGLGAATMLVGLLVVNMFGTHMIDSSVDGLFWVYLAMLAHLWPTQGAQASPSVARPPIAGGGAAGQPLG